MPYYDEDYIENLEDGYEQLQFIIDKLKKEFAEKLTEWCGGWDNEDLDGFDLYKKMQLYLKKLTK